MNLHRKLILAALLLLPFTARADVTFWWGCESADLGANDFSAGDTGSAVTGGMSISATAPLVGSNSCLSTDSNDFYAFTTPSIVSTSSGSMSFVVRYATAVAGGRRPTGIFLDNTATNDEIYASAENSQETGIALRKAGAPETVIATDASNLAIDTNYCVVVRWNIATDDRKVEVYNSGGTLIDSAEDLTTDLAAFEPVSLDLIKIGNPSAHTNSTKVDSIRISQEYGEELQDHCFTTNYKPAFSGTSTGTVTSNSAVVNFTLDQNGTVQGVICLDGQTASRAQILAGNCSGGAAVDTFTKVVTAAGATNDTFTGLAAATTYDAFITGTSSIGGPSGTDPSFANITTSGGGSVALTATNVTPISNGYLVAGTCTGSGTLTVEAVACAQGDAAPSSNELEAGQCGGGNSALMNASEVWTTAVGNDFNLTSSGKPPLLDVYVGCTNGTTDATNVPHPDEVRSPESGQAIQTLTSLSTTGLGDCTDCYNGASADSRFNPDVTAGVSAEYETRTNESANCKIVMGPDGDLAWYDSTDGVNAQDVLPDINETGDAGNDSVDDCANRKSFELSWENPASATDGCFTAPTGACFSADETLYADNLVPQCSPQSADEVILLFSGVAMTARDFNSIASDGESDLLTYTIPVGTLPAGTSLSGTGNSVWSGTPSTPNETGVALTGRASDVALDFCEWDFTVYVTDDSVTTPNVVGDTTPVALAELDAVRPWLAPEAQMLASFAFHASVPVGNIISQSPTTPSTMTASQVMTVSVSLGPAPVSSGGRPRSLGFGIGIP